MRWSSLLLMMIALAGCQSGEPDALPNDPMRVLRTKAAAPLPSAGMSERSGQSSEQLGKGYAVFMTKCLECHEARIAVDPGDPSWHPTMRGMSWNAGLDAASEEALIDYLEAASKE